jgi:hypothetical protein
MCLSTCPFSWLVICTLVRISFLVHFFDTLVLQVSEHIHFAIFLVGHFDISYDCFALLK